MHKSLGMHPHVSTTIPIDDDDDGLRERTHDFRTRGTMLYAKVYPFMYTQENSVIVAIKNLGTFLKNPVLVVILNWRP